MQDLNFKRIGVGNQVYDLAKIINPEKIEIGNYNKIDDFTFLFAGEDIKMGDHNHLASYTVIGGGGSIEIKNHVGVSWHVVFATGTNDYTQRKHMSAASPLKTQGFYHSKIIIESDVIIFANSVIVAPKNKPLIIGEGAIIGALSLVKEDIEPWSINVGAPTRKVGMRPKLLEGLDDE